MLKIAFTKINQDKQKKLKTKKNIFSTFFCESFQITLQRQENC